MKKCIGNMLVLTLLIGVSVSATAQVQFQKLKGKKYSYEIVVPEGKYEYSRSSSEREHWGTYNEPYAGVYAYKDAWYPEGALGSRTMEEHIRKNDLYEGDQLLDYSDSRTDMPGGFRFDSRFRIKRKDGSLSEHYVVIGILTRGKYKFNERIWVEASLVFHKENPEKEKIVDTFFSSFKME